MSRLLIIVVNYRTPELVVDCLRSLQSERNVNESFDVIVVDNNSEDDSIKKLTAAIAREGWANWATLMPANRNGGFAFGNNLAIRATLQGASAPDYFLLLNPDTIVRPGAILALTTFMDASPHAGMAGSRLEHPDGTPQQSAFRYPSIVSELNSGLRTRFVTRISPKASLPLPPNDGTYPVDWVAGASMIIRRDVFEQIGLLDDGYFMYFEEVEFCLRARRAGWECWYVSDSRVMHLVGCSSNVSKHAGRAPRLPRYWFASRRRFLRINYGMMTLLSANCLWIFGYVVFRIRKILMLQSVNEPPWLLWDFARFSFFPLRIPQ